VRKGETIGFSWKVGIRLIEVGWIPGAKVKEVIVLSIEGEVTGEKS